MKILKQIFLILLISFLGEALHALLPLPIPSSVYGLVLLFLALCFGIVKLEQVKDAAGFLISILPILFVPTAVGILENWAMIQADVIPIVLLALISTVATFGIAGRITQSLRKKEEKSNEASGIH